MIFYVFSYRRVQHLDIFRNNIIEILAVSLTIVLLQNLTFTVEKADAQINCGRLLSKFL